MSYGAHTRRRTETVRRPYNLIIAAGAGTDSECVGDRAYIVSCPYRVIVHAIALHGVVMSHSRTTKKS